MNNSWQSKRYDSYFTPSYLQTKNMSFHITKILHIVPFKLYDHTTLIWKPHFNTTKKGGHPTTTFLQQYHPCVAVNRTCWYCSLFISTSNSLTSNEYAAHNQLYVTDKPCIRLLMLLIPGVVRHAALFYYGNAAARVYCAAIIWWMRNSHWVTSLSR
jgi:hypothetical protein